MDIDDPRRPGKHTEDLRKRLREYWECTADCRPPIGESKCLCALLNEAADALELKILTAEKLREAAEDAKARGAVGKKDRWA
jgi:hypothetical protein